MHENLGHTPDSENRLRLVYFSSDPANRANGRRGLAYGSDNDCHVHAILIAMRGRNRRVRQVGNENFRARSFLERILTYVRDNTNDLTRLFGCISNQEQRLAYGIFTGQVVLRERRVDDRHPWRMFTVPSLEVAPFQ